MCHNLIAIHYAKQHANCFSAFAKLCLISCCVSSSTVCISFCLLILYVTIWCKVNKLIIYLHGKLFPDEGCLVIPLISCFSFVQVITFWKSIFRREASRNGTIIAIMVSWKHISGRTSIDERDHHCECGQLETVEHVLREFPLHPAERDLLRKVSPELNLKILLDTKKSLDVVVKFLDL